MEQNLSPTRPIFVFAYRVGTACVSSTMQSHCRSVQLSNGAEHAYIFVL